VCKDFVHSYERKAYSKVLVVHKLRLELNFTDFCWRVYKELGITWSRDEVESVSKFSVLIKYGYDTRKNLLSCMILWQLTATLRKENLLEKYNKVFLVIFPTKTFG